MADAVDGAVGVRFDFDGALDLARVLSGLAGSWEAGFERRRESADQALAAWTGPAAAELAARMAFEAAASHDVVESLRAEASAWAGAWARATDEANRQRWLADLGVGVVAPEPPPVPVPRGPSFAPVGLSYGSRA